MNFLNNKLHLNGRKTMMHHLAKVLVVLAALIPSVLYANTLSNAQVVTDLNSNATYQYAPTGSYQYKEADYVEPSTISDYDAHLEFFEDLKDHSPVTTGGPTYVPIGVGSITTIIPIYPRLKSVGTPFVQNRYVRSQVYDLLGRHLIDSSNLKYSSEIAQLQSLYQNAVTYAQQNQGVSYGDNLSFSREQSPMDMVWVERRNINGQEVAVPVLYLTANTVATYRVEEHEVEFGGIAEFGELIIDDVTVKAERQTMISVLGDLTCVSCTIEGDGDLQLIVGGDVHMPQGITIHTAGSLLFSTPGDLSFVDGASVTSGGDLIIGARSISAETLVYRYDLGGESGTRYGEIVRFDSVNGKVELRSLSDISLYGVEINAGTGIVFDALGDIYLGSVEVSSFFEENGGGRTGQGSSLDYLTTKLAAEDTIELVAAGTITIDAAEIDSNRGHLNLLADLGITIESDLSQYASEGKFIGGAKDSAYKTVAIRALLDAGETIFLHTKAGDIKLTAVGLTSEGGATIQVDDGNLHLLVTRETDQYSYVFQNDSLLTNSVRQRGHNIQTLAQTTIAGGLKVDAAFGMVVQYESPKSDSEAINRLFPNITPNTSKLDQQIEVLKQNPNLAWVAALRDDPTLKVDWHAVETVYETWEVKSKTLTPAAVALISIMTGMATAGDGAAITGAAEGSFQAYAADAIFAQIVTTAAVAGANSLLTHGELLKAYEDAFKAVVEEEALTDYAVTFITAGLIDSIDASFFTPDQAEISAAAAQIKATTQTSLDIETIRAAVKGLSFGQQVGQALLHSAVRVGVNSLAEGESLSDFGDAFVKDLASYGVSVLGQHMANGIGSAFDVSDASSLESALKYISHAGAGCILGAASGVIEDSDNDAEAACASGAGGAVIGEFIGGVYRSSEEIAEAEAAINEFLLENKKYVEQLAELGFNQSEIMFLLNQTSDLPYYTSRLDGLLEDGVNIARLGAAIGAFAAGANESELNIAADLGANAAENNAFFLLAALPIILTSLDITLTALEIVEIAELYEKAHESGLEEDMNKANERFAYFAAEGAIGLAIPGDKIAKAILDNKLVETIVEHALESGKNLGKRAESIIAYAKGKIDPPSNSIPDTDLDKETYSFPSDGGRGGMSNPLNVPEPNSIYHVDGRYRYETDAEGNISNVKGSLQLSPGTRSCYQQRLAGSCGLSTDEGGHLIGTQFNGSGARINLVPQDAQLNRGAGSPWAAMEREWADALGSDLPVEVNIDLEYPAGSQRPDKFTVTYIIDGIEEIRTFYNQAGG